MKYRDKEKELLLWKQVESFMKCEWYSYKSVGGNLEFCTQIVFLLSIKFSLSSKNTPTLNLLICYKCVLFNSNISCVHRKGLACPCVTRLAKYLFSVKQNVCGKYFSVCCFNLLFNSPTLLLLLRDELTWTVHKFCSFLLSLSSQQIKNCRDCPFLLPNYKLPLCDCFHIQNTL